MIKIKVGPAPRAPQLGAARAGAGAAGAVLGRGLTFENSKYVLHNNKNRNRHIE